jgi:Leucine-rich repeat (LRR) protein
LGYSKLTGSIPSAFGKLTDLTDFDIAYNQLVGSLPHTIAQHTQLRSINLAGNQLTGSIPSAIGMLTDLSYLGLSANQLTGTVPQELVGLNFITLDLSMNPRLTGKLPAFNFSQFTCCYMNGDVFKCPLPAGAEKCVGGPPAHCTVRSAPTCAVGLYGGM